jgi:4-hydroxybenzoate polyprenyltransferase
MGATPVLYNLALASADGTYNFHYCPLFVMLALSSLFSLVTIFLYRNRKLQALFCLFNALLIVGWYVCYFVVGQTVGDKTWGTVDFRPSWPAVFPAIACILYFMARHAINADEKLVRSMDRIR